MKYNIIERDCFQVVGIKREFSLVNGENLTEIPKCGMMCMRMEPTIC